MEKTKEDSLNIEAKYECQEERLDRIEEKK